MDVHLGKAVQPKYLKKMRFVDLKGSFLNFDECSTTAGIYI